MESKVWHFSNELKERACLPEHQDYVVLPGSQDDVEKVAKLYSQSPVPGMKVDRVEVVYNPGLNRAFSLHLRFLQRRHGNQAFEPRWEQQELRPDYLDLRRANMNKLKAFAKPYGDSDYPNVTIVPVWYGSRSTLLDSIVSSGFANLATNDSGFFGKGINGALEAQYSHQVYSKGLLMICWMAFYSAYPVVDTDMEMLSKGGENYGNYDAHFVPVVGETDHPKESVYFALRPGQRAKYNEVVVFDKAACLPRYIVHLAAEDAMSSPEFGTAFQPGAGMEMPHASAEPFKLGTAIKQPPASFASFQLGAGMTEPPVATAANAASKSVASPASTEPSRYRALYDYKADDDDELSFCEDDILLILKTDPSGWWDAELNGQRGQIPANFLEAVAPTQPVHNQAPPTVAQPSSGSGRTGRSLCRALFDYDAAEENEISFVEDDIITILAKDPSGWWDGELNGRRGCFPSNFVTEI